MKAQIYKHLLRVNRGFDLVLRSIAALEKHSAFDRSELRRFRALSQEARAATNSYLAAAVESVETDEAGRLFRKRLAREKRDEAGPDQ